MGQLKDTYPDAVARMEQMGEAAVLALVGSDQAVILFGIEADQILRQWVLEKAADHQAAADAMEERMVAATERAALANEKAAAATKWATIAAAVSALAALVALGVAFLPGKH